jgi:hypothetical protein
MEFANQSIVWKGLWPGRWQVDPVADGFLPPSSSRPSRSDFRLWSSRGSELRHRRRGNRGGGGLALDLAQAGGLSVALELVLAGSISRRGWSRRGVDVFGGAYACLGQALHLDALHLPAACSRICLNTTFLDLLTVVGKYNAFHSKLYFQCNIFP